MKIAVIGTGGVGGFFGGKLVQLMNQKGGSMEVYFVARKGHLKEIQDRGLLLKTQGNPDFLCIPTLATDQISVLPDLDLVLICVKSYDLDAVLDQLTPMINARTTILPLLNGVDIYQRIRKKMSGGYVLPACAYLGTHIQQSGVVEQKGGSCTIFLGADPSFPDRSYEPITTLLQAARIQYVWQEDPFVEIWRKYIFIASFGMVTAAEHLTIGEAMESANAAANIKKIMQEIVIIAGRTGVCLPEDIVQISFAKGHEFPHDTKTSFQRDYESPDRKDERELYGRTILRMALEFGVEVPVVHYYSKSLDKGKG